MKLFMHLGMLMLVVSFCGLTDRLQDAVENGGDSTETTESGDTGSADGEEVKAAELTSDMEAKLDGDKVTWEEQGMTFKLPKGWPKMSVSKTSFQYGSPAKGFLIGTISSLGSDFPVDTSIKAYYDQAVQKAKDGDYEKVQYTMIDGVKGVEFVESMPEDKGDPRRVQWIGYRTYNDQTQMVNVMVSSVTRFPDTSVTMRVRSAVSPLPAVSVLVESVSSIRAAGPATGGGSSN